MKAYFSYVNARKGADGRRGVFGRQINFVYLDDGYNPANTVQLTRQLVEQTKVFAIVGTLGTADNLAVRPYLNAAKVPQMLVSTGATTWGRDWKKYPWTTGWQPDYELEARIYGQAIAHNAGNQKIAVLYQNDDYGNDYLRGLKAGLGAKAGNIAAAESYDVTATDVKSQIAKLRATRRDRLLHLRDAEVHGAVVRVRARAGLEPARDLHQLGLGHGEHPHRRRRRRAPARS